MIEKEAFFALDTKLQVRLRYYIVAISTLQMFGFIVVSQTMSPLSMIIGFGLNLLFLYFSLFIIRAPNFYFKIIQWLFGFSVVFSALDIYDAISAQQTFTPQSILAFLSIALAIGILPTLTKYRTSVSEAKKAAITP